MAFPGGRALCHSQDSFSAFVHAPMEESNFGTVSQNKLSSVRRLGHDVYHITRK